MDLARTENISMIIIKKLIIQFVTVHLFGYCIVGIWTVEIEIERTVPKTYIAKAKIAVIYLFIFLNGVNTLYPQNRMGSLHCMDPAPEN